MGRKKYLISTKFSIFLSIYTSLGSQGNIEAFFQAKSTGSAKWWLHAAWMGYGRKKEDLD